LGAELQEDQSQLDQKVRKTSISTNKKWYKPGIPAIVRNFNRKDCSPSWLGLKCKSLSQKQLETKELGA
jgi:hypothetical protein